MRWVWTIIRGLLIGLALLIALLLAWIVASSFYDEAPAPGFDAFFHSDPPAPAEQNGYLALGGIDAPDAAHMTEWGRSAAERYRQKPEDYSYLVHPPSSEALRCWLEQSSTACLSAEQLAAALADNRLFLENYRNLYRYPRFQRDSNISGVWFGADLIRLHALLLAQLSLTAAQGDAAQALDGWIADTQFLQRLMADKASMIDKSIFLVLYNMNLKTYPLIAARTAPAQLAVQRPQLQAIFDLPAFAPGGWDIAATMRWEKEALIPLLDSMAAQKAQQLGTAEYPLALYKPQATRNGFYAFAQDMVALSQLPPEALAAQHAVIKEKYRRKKTLSHTVSAVLYNLVGNMVLDGMRAGQDLLLAAGYNYERRQLLKLYTEACIAQVPASEMARYTAASPIKNPRTQTSFEYDEATRMLSTGDPSEARFAVQYEGSRD